MTQSGEITRARIVEFIRYYQRTNHRPPTIREIASGTGISSTGGVNYHLLKLEEAGVITSDPESARSVRLTECDVEYVNHVCICYSCRMAEVVRGEKQVQSWKIDHKEIKK
jgi:SOS-response transcriptional repressor LexA